MTTCGRRSASDGMRNAADLPSRRPARSGPYAGNVDSGIEPVFHAYTRKVLQKDGTGAKKWSITP